MRAEDIRKAVKPYIPGWVAEQTAVTYPQYWLGFLGLFQMYNAAGSRVAMGISVTNSSYQSGMSAYAALADLNNGDYYVCDIPLAAGTYCWQMSYYRGGYEGKFDLYVDGVKVNGATPIDFYGSNAYNQLWSVNNIVIASDGVHTFKILNVGKNASSGDYACNGSTIAIVRTA